MVNLTMATKRARPGDSSGSLLLVVLGVIAIVLLMNSCGSHHAAGAAPVTSSPATTPVATATPAVTPPSAIGRPITVTAVEVQSVPADEGFWIGSSDDNRIWVELTGRPSESPYDVDKGDSVSFTGVVVANPKGFAARSGVVDSEGRRQLTAQGRHIQVDKDDLHIVR